MPHENLKPPRRATVSPLGSQMRQLVRFGISQSVDIHCHCLPGLDDGPESMAESIALCKALSKDGMTTVIATPHQLGRYGRTNTGRRIRAAVSALNAALLHEGLPIRVLPGADVRIDEQIPRLIEQSEVVTLGDSGRYILLELPQETCINPLRLLEELRSIEVTPILTHPERCTYLTRNPMVVLEWAGQGMPVQLTAGSLIGCFGQAAQQTAWYLLAAGGVALVATDAHDTLSRRPCMSDAITAISSCLDVHTAKRICLENPLRVLKGEPIITAHQMHGAYA